jgi:ParB-like chromosome segregation protein Spo0J
MTPQGKAAQPINRITWVDVNRLTANDYNPNSVMTPEMKLLALSIRTQGWIQPILVWPDPVTGDFVIIDGYHRHMVCKSDKEVWAMTAGFVPVVVMDMTVGERMLLTIRINRAKGNHSAVKMHHIVAALVEEHGYTPKEIGVAIGADKSEVEVLLAKNVFEHKKVTETNYGKAWYNPGVENHSMSPPPDQPYPKSAEEAK